MDLQEIVDAESLRRVLQLIYKNVCPQCGHDSLKHCYGDIRCEHWEKVCQFKIAEGAVDDVRRHLDNLDFKVFERFVASHLTDQPHQ